MPMSRNATVGLVLGRIGSGDTLRRDTLPDQHCDDEKRGYEDADAQSGLHLPWNLSYAFRSCWRWVAFF